MKVTWIALCVLAGLAAALSFSPSAMASYCTAPTDVHAYYVDFSTSPASVTEVCQDGDSWNVNYMFFGGTSSAPASGTALVSHTYSGQENVYYVGQDLHVYELYHNISGSWNRVDATAASGAPNVGSLGSLTGYPKYVYYLGADLHVHELYYYNGGWHTVDVTAATGAPNAASGSRLASYYDSRNAQHSVYFIGSDAHVHQLYYLGSWHTMDLTAETASLSAEADSPIAAHFNYSSIRHNVYYVDTTGEAHWLYYDSSWHDGGPMGGTVYGTGFTSYPGGALPTDENIFFQGSDSTIYDNGGAYILPTMSPLLRSPLTGFANTYDGQSDSELFYLLNDGALAYRYFDLVWQGYPVTGAGGVLPSAPNPDPNSGLSSFVGP